MWQLGLGASRGSNKFTSAVGMKTLLVFLMQAARSNISTSVVYMTQLDLDATSRGSNTFTSVAYMNTQLVF